MDTRTVAQRLALAESRTLHGNVHLSRQRALVRHLERNGLSSRQARKALMDMEKSQRKLIAERDQLELDMTRSPTIQVSVAPL